jgi:hypothetical protein
LPHLMPSSKQHKPKLKSERLLVLIVQKKFDRVIGVKRLSKICERGKGEKLLNTTMMFCNLAKPKKNNSLHLQIIPTHSKSKELFCLFIHQFTLAES